MKKIRVQERDGDVWNSRTSLIRCHLSGDKELREQAMHTPEGRASAKALRQDGAWRGEDQRGGPGVEAALVLVTGVGNEGLTGKDFFFFFLQF